MYRIYQAHFNKEQYGLMNDLCLKQGSFFLSFNSKVLQIALSLNGPVLIYFTIRLIWHVGKK